MITPSYLLVLADEFAKQGLDARKTSLQVGIFGAEPWTPKMRGEIEQLFGMDAVDIYGLSEIIGPGVANECAREKEGLYVWEDHFYPEVIDPETGEVLPDGKKGELVFTSLTKEAFPVIRYRTRDLTRLLPGGNRAMRRMEKVTGRSDDMMIVRGVNVFPTQIEEILLEDSKLSPNYQIELTREERLDVMTLLIEPKESGLSDSMLQESSGRLSQQVKSRIGVSVQVQMQPIGGVERSMGKARRIVDKRPKV